MKLTLIAIYTIISTITFAQTTPPNIQWQKSFGGSSYDVAECIRQTKDSGYIIAGYSLSNDSDVSGHHGDYDYWIVKLKKNGDIQWQKSLGGSRDDKSYSIEQTKDNGYIVAGYTESNDGDVNGKHGYADYWIVKLTKKGAIEWQKCIGGSSTDIATSIQQTKDSGYIIAGYSLSNDGDASGHHDNYDYWIVKLKKDGNIQWQKSFGGSLEDEAFSIRQTNDNGYIVVGHADSYDGDVTGNHKVADYWILKLTKTGNIQWQKSLGGSGMDLAKSVQQTKDSGYIIAGYSSSHDGDVTGYHSGYEYDYWIVKLTKQGSIQWQKSFGGSSDDRAYSIQQTNDNGYIIAGYTVSNDGDVSGRHAPDFKKYDYWIVKVTKKGEIQWQKCLGGFKDDEAYSIQQTKDDGYVIAGEAWSNGGDVSENYGGSDYWIVKLNKDETFSVSSDSTNTFVNNLLSKRGVETFTIYPNPAKDVLYVQTNSTAVFSLINTSGKIVLTKNITGNGSFNISSLSAGSYYLKNNKTQQVQQLAIEK